MSDHIEARTLWELIERRAAATPDALMLVDESDRSLSYGGYRDACERAAAGLAAEHGVVEGTQVAWELPTWIESFVLVGALARLGALQIPMLPIYREREVSFITRQNDARLMIVPSVFRGFDYEAMANTVAAGLDGCDVIVADKWLPEGDPAKLPPFAAPPGDLPARWVFYTSGTTADPKGARHTDATIMASGRAIGEALDATPDDVQGFVFPFTHIGGASLLMATLMCGFNNIIVEAFDPPAAVDLFDRHGMTLAGAGTVFHQAYLAEARKRAPEKILQRVRAFTGGGAPKPPQLHYDLKAEIGGVGIVSSYGLTETPILTYGRPDDPDEKLANTEGRANPGVEFRVVDGELRVKGPQVFLGYVDSSLDADAFDDEGRFRTGDLATIDADGYVVITGRLKDIIIRKGENISAKEVEDLLYTHPKVADVAVIGLPDPKLGERCCAVVASRDPADQLIFEEMVSFLHDQGLMNQKIPEQLELVEAVPRNPSGKILKHVLREQYS